MKAIPKSPMRDQTVIREPTLRKNPTRTRKLPAKFDDFSPTESVIDLVSCSAPNIKSSNKRLSRNVSASAHTQERYPLRNRKGAS